MDLWKYYDLVDAPVALDFLQQLGLHHGVYTALSSFYAHLRRYITINGVCGPSFRSKPIVLQGCAWSNPLAAAMDVAWSCFVEQQAKLAEELTVANARLAEVVADIALIEVQLGEVQQKTDKVFGKVDNIKSA